MTLDEIADGEVRRLARALLPQSEVIAGQVTEHVVRLVPELAPAGGEDAVAVVRHSTDQNIGAMLATMAFGVPSTTIDAPAGTQDLVRRMLAGGGDVTHLLRAYRVGHDLLWRIWTDHVEAELDSSTADDRGPLLLAVLRTSSRHLFDFIDAVCQRIVADFPTDPGPGPGRVGGTGELGRAAVVRALLGSEAVDVPAAGRALGHDLTRVHVALVASPLSDTAGVRHEVQRLIDRTGAPALTLPAGDGTWWGWISWPARPGEDELVDLARLTPDDVLIGLGEPGRGREGFRTSHTRAREAERVARLRPGPRGGVTRFADVELAAVLCADPDRARRFATDRLGRLAEDDEAVERLRATLRAYLAHGHSRADAARALAVHHKTVTYRIGQAEKLLGRSLTSGTGDLDAALTIHAALHGP
ncbi:MAG TPA: helix-turn-helix domain-containing protein [Actinomycetospora sp.]|uniref:PucR family transcriptional regulator n=1 Tax=Actinomycetospora sp. TaxID=1872135 RepID=UPI002F42A0A6